ncbi:MAG: FAD-dependent oxidoreductase [Erythrobacter sp.]
MPMMLSRRSLIQRTAATMAVASSAPAYAGRSLAAERADVIVIGAGLSGLNTAMTLRDAGYKVLVLEANNRVGGRAYTADDVEGRPEYGANQIGPQYARLRGMAKTLGVKLEQGANLNAPFAFSLNGEMISKESWPDSKFNLTKGDERALLPTQLMGHYLVKHDPFKTSGDWLQSAASTYDISLGSWFQSLGASPAALRLMNQGLIAPDLWSASALDKLQGIPREFLAALNNAKSDVRGNSFEQAAPVSSRVAGGTQRLPEAMAATLGDAVRLNQAVSRLDTDDYGVEVRCMDGKLYKADFAVSAIPLTVLRRISIYPNLSGDQREAVMLTPYASTTFVYLNVKKPYWEEDGFDASLWTDGPINSIRQPYDYTGSRERLVVVSTGLKGQRLDQLPPKERGEFVLKQIETLRPAAQGQLEVSGVHSWAQEPFSAGCSSALPAGHTLRFANALIKPHGRIHFAGEHTKRLEVGMESAMESGERVASEIISRSQGVAKAAVEGIQE